MATDGLNRFTEAQAGVYNTALREVRSGRKATHWMWFIFPQVQGLGYSDTAKFYAIKDLKEARQYLDHAILGPRLVEISSELLRLTTDDPVRVFGHTDSLKLKSSMTLFSLLEDANPVFRRVLEKFFQGERDKKTIELVGGKIN